MVREAVAEVLRDAGAEVLEARSGSQALELLLSAEVDVLFSDVRMPEMDGVELARQARIARPALRIVLTTAWLGQIDTNGWKVIMKPWDAAELLRILLEPEPAVLEIT